MTNDEDQKDPRIEPMNYLSGVKVVDMGDLRVARGMSRRPHSSCKHNQLRYDDRERRIWCADCETNVEAFDAFLSTVEWFARAYDDLESRRQRLLEAEAHALISVAAKNADKAWRSKMVPSCPHCGHGLFPEHFRGDLETLSRQYALARLERDPLRRMRNSAETKDTAHDDA